MTDKHYLKYYEWIEICKKWIKENGNNLPEKNDIIEYEGKMIKIGKFINNVKNGKYKMIKPMIEKTFNQKIISINENWIDICKKWVELYGNELPKKSDVIEYDDRIINIGKFIVDLKNGRYKILKSKIEKIFNQKIEFITHKDNDDNWIEICKYWINKYGKILPKRDDTIVCNNKIYNIGFFIYSLKNGFHRDIKDKIEKMFNRIIESKQHVKDDEWLIVCKYWIDINGKILPKQKEVIRYKNKTYQIGSFISRLKDNDSKKIKPQLEELFGMEIKPLYKIHQNLN
jgi:hypothetical protein